jgi:hypothetical protein
MHRKNRGLAALVAQHQLGGNSGIAIGEAESERAMRGKNQCLALIRYTPIVAVRSTFADLPPFVRDLLGGHTGCEDLSNALVAEELQISAHLPRTDTCWLAPLLPLMRGTIAASVRW